MDWHRLQLEADKTLHLDRDTCFHMDEIADGKVEVRAAIFEVPDGY